MPYMKKNTIAAFCLMSFFFAACSGGGQKKVVVMANGKFTVTDKTIKIDPSLTHNEQELYFKDDKLTLTVENTAGGTKTFDLTENGVYLLNLQSDTLIGGIVNYGTGGMPATITAEALDHIIDSTQQLMAGQNANDAKGTFFLPPFTIKKISAKENTRLVGSFKGIPYKIEEDNNGKIPEVFKFFTTKQKRETLNDLMEQRAKIKNIH
jgi:hypothetical protein